MFNPSTDTKILLYIVIPAALST